MSSIALPFFSLSFSPIQLQLGALLSVLRFTCPAQVGGLNKYTYVYLRASEEMPL